MQIQTGTLMGKTIMQEPPNVVTTKDLMYLQDALSWELLAMKKCHTLANMAQEQAVKDLCDRIGRRHKAHYELLKNHLNPSKSANNFQGGFANQ